MCLSLKARSIHEYSRDSTFLEPLCYGQCDQKEAEKSVQELKESNGK